MNNLIVSQNQTLTMSSREIAELTGKTHSNVKRDISAMILQLNYPDRKLQDCPIFDPSELKGHGISIGTYNHCGNVYDVFDLDKRYTELLITGYSVTLRLKVIDRLAELESNQAPKLPQTFAEALQLAADQAKQLELAAPKVEFVDRFVERESLQNATQVASSLNMKSARALNKALDEIGGVYNGAVKRSRIFTAKFISDGYGDVKQNESGYPQSLFTTKGVTRIHELLVSEGYI